MTLQNMSRSGRKGFVMKNIRLSTLNEIVWNNQEAAHNKTVRLGAKFSKPIEIRWKKDLLNHAIKLETSFCSTKDPPSFLNNSPNN